MYSDFSKRLLLGLVLVLGLFFVLAKKFAGGKNQVERQNQQHLAAEELEAVPKIERHDPLARDTSFVESLRALPFFSKKRVIKSSEYSLGKSHQSGVLVLKVGDETVQTLKSQLTPAKCPKTFSIRSRCVALMNENVIEVNKELREQLPAWLNYEAQYLGNAQTPPRPPVE